MSYTNFESNSSIAGNCGFLLFKRTNNFAAVGSGDILGQIQSQGFDGVQFQTASFINISATGAPAVNIPSKLQFYSSTGTATHLAMSIGQYGQVTLTDPFVNQATLVVQNNQSTPNINLRTANATPSNAPHIHFTRSGVGIADAVANDELGRLEYFGFQGGTAREAGEITAVAETVNGTDAVSSYLSFRTVPTSYAAMAERMRISADGTVTINTPVSGISLNINGVASGIAAQINNAGTSLNFSSTAQRITADMSNATHANRLAFQTNTVNGATSPFILPNGTSQTASIIACNNSTPANSAFAQLQVDNTSAKIVSGILGAGTLLPLELRVGNANTAVSISTNRNVTINTPAATGVALTVNAFNATGNYAAEFSGNAPGALFDGIRVLNNVTTAGSSSQIECSVSSQALTTGGDPYLRFINYGVSAVSLGLDTSTQQFAMTSGSGVGGANNFFTWTASNNQINLPLQASFHAYSGADQLNVTGAGAVYQVLFNTERFDVANGYDTATSTYTAPASGKYMFYTQVRVDNLTAAMDQGFIVFQVNGATFTNNDFKNPTAAGYAGAIIAFQGTNIINLAAGDTVKIFLIINNGAGNTADILTTVDTYFCGQLLS